MKFFIALIIGCAVFNLQTVRGHELSGSLAIEGRAFQRGARFPEQKKYDASAAIQPEYYHEWANGSGFTFEPFARLDSADSNRTHYDVRELNCLWLADNWELKVGVSKVFWGATEFVHLIDVVNQTDLVESIDEEEKLGQPMAHLSIPTGWGVFDLFALPYFRERTFPSRQGRLRSNPPVDDDAEFESDAEERHLDFAARYSNTFGDMDLGVYNFHGTGRAPTFRFKLDEGGPKLIPFYEQINQTGIDIQMVAGQWILKLEALRKIGQGVAYTAAVGGFEYTMVRLAGTEMDLGLLGEWAWDERGDDAASPFDNDAMFGLRLTVNDQAGTEFLAGVIQDVGSPSRIMTIEASSRFGDNWKASLEVRSFQDVEEDDPLFSFRDDDFAGVQIVRYF